MNVSKLFLCRVKENQLDAQLILTILSEPVHVSGVSRPIIKRYICMYYDSW